MASLPPATTSAARLGWAPPFVSITTRFGDLRAYISAPATPTPPRCCVVVLHGKDRDAAKYAMQWQRAIGVRPVAAIVPEFDNLRFPGWRGYNLGGMLTRKNEPTPPEDWLFPTLDGICKFAQQQFNGVPVHLFGHSAGAQLLTRYTLFGQDLPANVRYVAANAGWYTLPDPTVPFPHGLSDAATSADLRTAFSRCVTILVGDRDTDSTHHSLRRDRKADQQGVTRLERARFFMNSAQTTAEALSVPLRWKLSIVEGAGHSNRAMADGAMNLIGSSS